MLFTEGIDIKSALDRESLRVNPSFLYPNLIFANVQNSTRNAFLLKLVMRLVMQFDSANEQEASLRKV